MTSKCCFVVPLRIGAFLFGLISLIIRFQLTYYWSYHLTHWFTAETPEERDSANLVDNIIQIVVLGIVGNIADLLLIFGILKTVQKWVKCYQYAIILVFVYEILLFFVLFVLGYHWLDELEYLILGLFHLWAWFTIKKLNENWNEEMK